MFLEDVKKIMTDRSTEIMFHPAKGVDSEKWRLVDLKTLTNRNVVDYFENNVELISYSDL